jgi:serine/threonine-protein kinase
MDRFRGSQLALSPDGTHIVVAESDANGKLHLVMRSLDQSRFVPLPGVDFGYMPFFSPDGHWMGFFADGKLKKIPVQGGEPVTLSDVPDPRGASWGDDGNIVLAFNGGSTGLVRVLSGGGVPTSVTQLSPEKGETIHAWPQVLPGSQAVLFTAFGANYTDGQIEVVSLRTGERKILYSRGAFGRYLPSGHLLYIHQNTLFAVPFDLGRQSVLGAPQPVLEDVNLNWLGSGDFDFSQTGTFVFVNSKTQPFPYSIWWLDSAGQTRTLHATLGLYENPRFSPDGNRLAFECQPVRLRRISG